MKSSLSWLALIVSIAVLVSSCSKSDDTKTASTDNSTPSSDNTTTTDTTATTVSSVSTTADNQSSIAITDNITVTFSEAMDTTLCHNKHIRYKLCRNYKGVFRTSRF